MSKKMLLDILWGVAMVSGIVLCLWGINLPYVGIYNANNNYLALAAKNFLRFGYSTLHYLPTYYTGQELPSVIPYYLHHPVLFFLVAAVPLRLFGIGNWVVHVATFVCVLASLWTLFRLINEVATREIARWTVVFAVLMNLTSFFWKYMFFEQSSLFFTLLTLYFCVRYWKAPRQSYLWGIGIAAFFGGATDWYGGYLAFGFLYLLIARTGKRIWPTFITYLVGECIGLGTYILALMLTGNIHAFWDGFSARGLTHELTSLPYWPIRLAVVTLIRILIYGSPLLIIAVWSWLRRKSSIGIVLLIIGLINIIVLPSATWGHSYFLFYLVPFLALVLGVWVAGLTNRKVGFVWLVIIFQMVWSFSVGFLKLTQVTKQTWKYDFARDVSRIVTRYSTVGVIEYPGDVLQNYFFIDTAPVSLSTMATLPGRIRYIVITCKGVCTGQETTNVARLDSTFRVQAFQYGKNIGWLVDRTAKGTGQDVPMGGKSTGTFEIAPKGLLRLYRTVRDFLGSTQI